MSPAPQNENQSPDDAALDRQVRTFLGSRTLIQATIRALVRDAALAEDVFQEVWLRFERVTRHGEIVSNVPAWCRAAARLVALEMWRTRHRERPTPDEELAALIDRAYEEQDGREEYWRGHAEALGQCIGALPARSRELLTQRYGEDAPVAVIATQRRQSVGSVKTALCRLRLALAGCVQKKLGHQGVA